MPKVVIGWVEFPTYLEKDIVGYLYILQKSKTLIKKGLYSYTVCDLEAFDNFVFGRMLKLTPRTKKFYLDENDWTQKEEERKRIYVEQGSRFIIFKDYIIILEDNTPNLSYITFKKVLRLLLAKVVETVSEFDIAFKKDVVEIKQFLDKTENVTRIVFENLKVPNPIDIRNPKVVSAKAFLIDERAKKIIEENKEKDGLNTSGAITEGLLTFVQEGFGDAQIKGKIKETGREEIYETKKKLRYKYFEAKDDKSFIDNSLEIKKEEGG